MSSKKVLLGAVALVLWVTACSLKTDDKAVVFESARVNGGRYGCLANMGDTLNKYFQGDLNKNQVEVFFRCFRTALKDFDFHMSGKEADRFSPNEIVNFLNAKFLAPLVLTESMTKEIMTFKVLFVGGDEGSISRAEYAKLVEYLDVIQEEALRNLPYVRLYRIVVRPSIIEPENPVNLLAAKKQLKATTNRFAEHLSKSGKNYSLDSFERFLNEGRSFLKWDELNQGAAAATDIRELLSRFKETMVGGDRQIVTSREWQPLFSSLTGIYGVYLDFEYLVRGQSVLYGLGLENFIQVAEDALTLLQSSINRQEKKIVDFATMDGLIDVLDRMKLIPLNIRGSSLKPTLKYAIQHVLRDPLSSIDPESVRGLNMSALNELRKEFYNWADSQRFLNAVAQEELNQRGAPDIAASDIHRIPFLGSVLKDFDLKPLFKDARWEDRDRNIEYLVKNVTPLFRVDDNRVWIVPPEERSLKFDVRHGLHDLGLLNVVRVVVRQLIRGFASPERVLLMATDPGVTGVTDLEMEKFYQTARHLGEDLLFMDPRKDQVGLRIFREGNIFTYVGNGIQDEHKDLRHLMSFTEAIEVISMMWSGGQVRDALYSRISAICERETGRTPELDIVGVVKIDRYCFFKHLGDNEFSDFANLPYMQRYLASLDHYGRHYFYNLLVDISRIPNKKGDNRCFDNEHIELSELATIATLMHYLETLFMVYDIDQNGWLNEYEIMSAFPRFRGFLAQVIYNMPDEEGNPKRTQRSVAMLKSIFAFIVKERRTPASEGWQAQVDNAKVAFETWRYSNDPDVVDKNLPELRADRLRILQVLVMLNSNTAEAKANQNVVHCRGH